MVHVDTQLLSVLGGTIIPLLVGLLTKEKAPRWVKSIGLAGLAAVAGAVSTAATGNGDIVWQSYATNIAVTWISAVATYYGLWEPTGVAPKVAAVTGGFGLGRKSKVVQVSWSDKTPEV